MNFSRAEIETLRLVGWYKSLPQELTHFGSVLLSPAGIETLFALKLLHRDTRGCLQLTPRGWSFLYYLGFHYPRDKYYTSDPTKLRRRKEAAQISFTFYRAGINIFADIPDLLASSLVYLSATAARRNTTAIGSKVWAGNRLAGIACMDDTAYMLHTLNNQGIFFTNEMKLFHSIASNCAHTACIYVSDSYQQAASYLVSPQEHLRGGYISFYDAFQKTTLPVHLLECSDVGAMQLQIMSIPNYHERLARLTLGSDFLPPPPTIPDADAMMDGQPLVIAADMDIKRIKRACLGAKEQGFKKIILILLPDQLDALGMLLHPIGNVEFFSAPMDALRGDWKLTPYEPTKESYRTPEGRIVDASDIPIRRKAGRPRKQTD